MAQVVSILAKSWCIRRFRPGALFVVGASMIGVVGIRTAAGSGAIVAYARSSESAHQSQTYRLSTEENGQPPGRTVQP